MGQDDIKKFWSRVRRKESDKCWDWTGSLRSPRGYGQIKIKGKTKAAHRVSWEIKNGPIPAGDMKGTMCVLHHCDNKKCVNPEHLFVGSQKDNVADMYSKGRNVDLSGTNNPAYKFPDTVISEIRSRYAFGSETQREIGMIYGISKSHIGNIIRHQRRA